MGRWGSIAAGRTLMCQPKRRNIIRPRQLAKLPVARGNWSEPLGNCPTWPETWTDRKVAIVQDCLLVTPVIPGPRAAWMLARRTGSNPSRHCYAIASTGDKSPSLTMSARVKHFSSALLYALKQERHFALLDGVAFSNRRLARNRFPVRNSVRPMHLFGRNRDHDYYFELPCEGERDTQSITRCSTTHHRDFRVVPRVN